MTRWVNTTIVLGILLCHPCVLGQELPFVTPATNLELPLNSPLMDALLTVEGQENLKASLSKHLLLVQAWPNPGFHEDPALVPTRIGMAVIVQVDKEQQVWTSSFLVEDVRTINLTIPGTQTVIPATIDETKNGLSKLKIGAEVSGLDHTGATISTKETKDARVVFVTPAGPDNMVIGQSAIAGNDLPPNEMHVIIPGMLPMGCPVFDNDGNLIAIALHPGASKTDRVLAAPAKLLLDLEQKP